MIGWHCMPVIHDCYYSNAIQVCYHLFIFLHIFEIIHFKDNFLNLAQVLGSSHWSTACVTTILHRQTSHNFKWGRKGHTLWPSPTQAKPSFPFAASWVGTLGRLSCEGLVKLGCLGSLSWTTAPTDTLPHKHTSSPLCERASFLISDLEGVDSCGRESKMSASVCSDGLW